MANKWFEHNATTHITHLVRDMLVEFGYAGYGWYNVLFEKLSVEPDRRLELKSIKYLADEFRCEEKRLKKFIHKYFDIEVNKKFFRSLELDERLIRFDNNQKQASEAGKQSGVSRRAKAEEQKKTKSDEPPFNDRSTTVEHNTIHYNTSHNNTIQENTEHNSNNTLENNTTTENYNIPQEHTTEIEENKANDSPDVFLNNSNPSDESISSNFNITSADDNNSISTPCISKYHNSEGHQLIEELYQDNPSISTKLSFLDFEAVITLAQVASVKKNYSTTPYSFNELQRYNQLIGLNSLEIFLKQYQDPKNIKLIPKLLSPFTNKLSDNKKTPITK